MNNCSCHPNQFPFQCQKFHCEMDLNGYNTCQGENGILAQIAQQKEKLKELRKTPCAHLGSVEDTKDGTDMHRCPLYGACTKQAAFNDIQSCDMCSDHTAVVHLIEPIRSQDFFVPFDGGKGSTTDGVCCYLVDVGGSTDVACDPDKNESECEAVEGGFFPDGSCPASCEESCCQPVDPFQAPTDENPCECVSIWDCEGPNQYIFDGTCDQLTAEGSECRRRGFECEII